VSPAGQKGNPSRLSLPARAMAGAMPAEGNPPGLGVPVDPTILEQGNLNVLVTKVNELSAGVLQGVDVAATPGVVGLIAPILNGVTRLGVALWDKLVRQEHRLQVTEQGLGTAIAGVQGVADAARDEFVKCQGKWDQDIKHQQTQFEEKVKTIEDTLVRADNKVK